MRKTKSIPLFPMNLGLDTNSIPGTQDSRALTVAKNVIINNRGSIKKKPGIRRLDYIGDDKRNLQGAIHFFATTGGSQRSEIIRVIGGKIEAIRDGIAVDLGASVHPTDVVTFERFANALIIHFENSPPQYYTIGGTLTDLTLLSGHSTSPPTFSRVHDFRLWYGGRPASPHILYASEINDPNDYTLANGGFSMRINDGDGDPLGVTGLSPVFRGDIFAYKFNSIYRIYRNSNWYGIDPVTHEVGSVHHNTIVAVQNDVYSVSHGAINSLANTDKYGAVEEATLSYSIYDYFQEIVNWSASKNMVAVYDKPSNSYLLSFASSGSSENDYVIGFNIKSGQFFEWEAVYYPVLARYFDLGRQVTLVGATDEGLGILDQDETTDFGNKISIEASSGVIFPLQNPKTRVNFTKVWLYARPTLESTEINLSYWINGDLIDTITFDTEGSGSTFEGTAGGTIGTGIIGTQLIGHNKRDFIILESALKGEGNSIQFKLTHTPPDDDLDQSCEIYGLEFEVDYEGADDDATVAI